MSVYTCASSLAVNVRWASIDDVEEEEEEAAAAAAADDADIDDGLRQSLAGVDFRLRMLRVAASLCGDLQ